MKQEYKFVYDMMLRNCDTLLHLLQKGADFAHEHKNADEILQGKLAEDMFDFKKQVQLFSDNVAGGLARVYGIAKPSMPDTETTFMDLIERINKTKEFAKTIDPETISGVEERRIKLPWMQEGMYFDAADYLQKFVLQNVFFHLVTAYGILRHKGVQIGKMDFIGNIEFKKE